MRRDRDNRVVILRHPAGWIASGLGSGFAPFAPGTAGSAAALLPWLLLRELPAAWYLASILAAFALGVWAAHVVVRRLGIEDPGVIVWDEFVGQWIALVPLLAWPATWPWVLAAFLLFRIFDVVKPWPVSWADRRVRGGLGVMLDDAFAGIYAALVLTLALYLMG